MFTALFAMKANTSYAQHAKITMNLENVSVVRLLDEIESRTDFRFVYQTREVDLNRIVSIKGDKEKVASILDRLFQNTDTTFKIIDKQIFLTKALDSKLNKSEYLFNGGNEVNLQFSVSGTVIDAQGVALSGANIVEKGTTNGVTADFDGNYSLNVTDADAILVVSYIGFATKEVPVNGSVTINITLAESASGLDEVVVVGYGTQKRSDISGAVSEIDQEDIAKSPVPNLSNALLGRAAGLISTQRSGEPGNDGSDIYIRGVGTTGNSSPIYVIDGIVRSSSDFSQLNSSEIQSFSILKDAASAAVFGVRGGNGVIVVTTKRGSEGKMEINFSTSLGVQETTRTPEFLNSYDYANLYNQALANEGKDPLYSDADLQKYFDNTNLDTHPDSDWLSVLNNTALMRNNDLSAYGGSDKVRYATSLSFLDQNGVVPSNNFKRYNFRSNVDADVTNTTKLSFDLSGRSENTNNIASNELFRWIMGTPPNRYPIRWSNGEYSSGPSYLAVPENGYRRRKIQVFRGRIELDQQLSFVDGLSFKAIAAYDKTFTDNKNWNFATEPFYTRLPDGTFLEGAPAATSLDENHFDDQSITLETHLNYEKTIGKSNLSGLLLYTQTVQKWNFLGSFRDGYTLGIDELNYGATGNRDNEGYSGSRARQGVVGRLNWSYNDKYTLEGSFRADGSEQFAKDKRWGVFPSIAASYVISKEPFFKDVSAIDFLKIRSSYGLLGNDRIGGQRFLYLQSFNIDGTAVFGDGNVQQAIVEGNIANPNVTWETVRKFNIGLDAILWGGKLSANIDYFSDKRDDILAYRDASVPDLLGVGLPIENLAKVNNGGVEVVLGHKNSLTDKVGYSMSANFTYVKNKVIFIDEPASTNENLRRTGLPLGTQFGFQSIGLFQTQEEVDNAAVQIGPTGPGDIRYADINEDNKIDDLDRVPIGMANIPEIIFGYTGNLYVHNFELSFLFQGATNVNQWYRGEGAWPFFVGAGALESNLDSWTPTNTGASEPRVLISPNNMNYIDQSSFWLKDASYVRLKNIELAYNVPVDALKQNFVKGLRIYMNAYNAYTWSKIKNFDPENADTRGWTYPQMRIWNVGVNFKF